MKIASLYLAGALSLLPFGAIYAQSPEPMTGATGMTLYTFDKDSKGESTCYEACATNWPPYMVEADQKMPEGWTEVSRTDGTKQWAYDGKPVYYFAKDEKAGDMKGDGLADGAWHVLK